MNERLPYYMAYPLPLQYDDERIERRDFEYMKSMYPMAVKMILPYVEAECDRMTYAGSVIYDEYPDQLQIRLMCRRIYDKVKKHDLNEEMIDEKLWNLVQILVCQELFQRRRQHRRDKRKYF